MRPLLLLPLLCWASSTQAGGQTLLTEQPLPRAELLVPAATGIRLSARIAQAGSDNQLRLLQQDRTSIAELEQHGDRNAMTVRQSGGDNRLSWRQVGNDLPDLQVAQSGAMQLSIVQTAPPR